MGRVLTVCLFVRKSRNDCCRETHAMWPRAPPSNLRKLLPPIPPRSLLLCLIPPGATQPERCFGCGGAAPPIPRS
jgi:hypothetical protein